MVPRRNSEILEAFQELIYFPCPAFASAELPFSKFNDAELMQ